MQASFYDQQYNGVAQTMQHGAAMNHGYNTSKGGMGGNGQYLQSMQNIPNGSYMGGNEGGLEPFPQLDGLGLQGVPGGLGGQMVYDQGMLGPATSANGSPFSGHETLSTYSHSPHMGQLNTDNKTWDEQRMSGFP